VAVFSAAIIASLGSVRAADLRVVSVAVSDPVAAPAMSTVFVPESSPARSASCFPVNRIEIDGAVGDLSFVTGSLDSYRGQCVGVKAIDRMEQRLTAELLEHGYVTTRVRIPQQNLGSGTLRFEMTPGVIHAIGFDRPVHDTTWRNAFPTRPGRLLNLRDLEQGLEQMKRVPSQDVQMQIAPAKIAGQSDIDLSLREVKPWKVTFDVNDGGSTATGALQGSATVEYDDLAHANDILTVGLNRNVQGGVAGGTRGNSVDYSVPVGYWTAGVNFSNFTFSQTIAGLTAPFTLSGKQHQGAVRLEKMLRRTQRVKTSVVVSVTQKSSNSFVDGTEIDVERRNSSYGQILLKDEINTGAATFAGSIGFRAGLPILGALPDITGIVNAPTSYYTMETVDVSGVVPLTDGPLKIRWEPHVNGQFTGEHLYIDDAFSIGNRYTVRGFDGSTALAGDSGYFWRNDLVFPTGSPQRSVYVGFDTGRVWGPTAGSLSNSSLNGVVFGMRGGTARGSFDVFAGFEISAPAGFRTAFPATGVDFTYKI